MDSKDAVLWQVLAAVAAGLAALLTRKAFVATWKASVGREPPADPTDPEVSWVEALAFAAGVGALVGAARLAAQRGAAGAWAKARGELPPGVGAPADEDDTGT